MFQTVRHWWSGGRGKVILRLFLFELLVVVIGVLIAQGLANWVSDQAERREARKLLVKMEDLGESLDRVANYWQKHGPCLRDHVNEIAREAVAGRAMTMEKIGRPGFPSATETHLSEDEWRRLEDYVGADRTAAFRDFVLNAKTIFDYSADISDEWATLKLMDQATGPPSTADRARIRLATAIIDNRIRWLIFNRRQASDFLADGGIPHGSDLPDSDSAVDQCGLIKDWR